MPDRSMGQKLFSILCLGVSLFVCFGCKPASREARFEQFAKTELSQLNLDTLIVWSRKMLATKQGGYLVPKSEYPACLAASKPTLIQIGTKGEATNQFVMVAFTLSGWEMEVLLIGTPDATPDKSEGILVKREYFVPITNGVFYKWAHN